CAGAFLSLTADAFRSCHGYPLGRRRLPPFTAGALGHPPGGRPSPAPSAPRLAQPSSLLRTSQISVTQSSTPAKAESVRAMPALTELGATKDSVMLAGPEICVYSSTK